MHAVGSFQIGLDLLYRVVESQSMLIEFTAKRRTERNEDEQQQNTITQIQNFKKKKNAPIK